ncbi:hypothetical protein EDD85DRAFT_938993 [Armillaria nabsnona]|nr:hypothetical protein EDD85DRAFT_938993 [Armillaria nabsnona]
MAIGRTMSVDLELLKPIATGNFVATLHSNLMPSFNTTLVEEAAVVPSDLSKLTGPLVQLQSYILESGGRLVFMQLIGSLMSFILYGILCDQIWDNLTSKTVVYVLWLTETVETVINIYDTFDIFCYDFGDLSGLDDVHITWFTIPILSGFAVVGCIAQLFYAWRMYKFSKKARWLCITISVIAFIQFAAAICCGIEVRNSGHYSNLPKNSKVKVTAIIWLGGAALCDTAIALCMTYLLIRSQTGLKSTRILLSRLIRLTIETGTITGWPFIRKLDRISSFTIYAAAIAAADMAFFLADHNNNNYYTVPANCLVKIYSNTVLAVCNSRMTGRIRGGRESTTLHSFDSFDMSIGGLNIELRDTKTNTNADSSLQPEFSQGSDDQEKVIGLNDRFLNTGSTAAVLSAKISGYIEEYGVFKAKGIEGTYVVAVNDQFTSAEGLIIEAIPLLGVPRSKYVMIVNDNHVASLEVDDDPSKVIDGRKDDSNCSPLHVLGSWKKLLSPNKRPSSWPSRMSFWLTLAIPSKESSTQWIARQCHDHDAKQRVTSYKSRNTFNLLQVDSQLSIPDLGVASGGWSQSVSQHSVYGSGEDSEPLPSTLPRRLRPIQYRQYGRSQRKQASLPLTFKLKHN